MDSLLIGTILIFITIKNLIFLKKNNSFKFNEKFSIFVIIIYVLSFTGDFMNHFYSENWEDFFKFASNGQEIAQLFGSLILIILTYIITFNDVKKFKEEKEKNIKSTENK